MVDLMVEEEDHLVRHCVKMEAVASVANASAGQATRAILVKMVKKTKHQLHFSCQLFKC